MSSPRSRTPSPGTRGCLPSRPPPELHPKHITHRYGYITQAPECLPIRSRDSSSHLCPLNGRYNSAPHGAPTTTGPPPRPWPSADDEPARCRAGDPEGRAATSGSHVHLTTVRRVRRPAPAPVASPRLRRRPSPWPPRRRNQPAPELTPPPGGGHALHPGPYPPDLSRWNSYGALTADFSRAPSRLACRTRAVWQYRHVPSLSGLLPPSPASPGSGFPQLQPGRCDDPAAESFHLRTVMKRLVAHGFHVPHA